MSKIKAVTNGNKLIIKARPLITSGSRNADELSVVFDKSWDFDSALYYVNFYTSDDNDGIIRRLDVSGNTGTCMLPEYITREDGYFHFGVFARADSDIVKTSETVGYVVEKGVCTAPSGDEHDTLRELRKRFIDLINSNVHTVSLDYGMRFEDIDMTFTSGMSDIYGTFQLYSSYASGLFRLVQEYINPDITEFEDDDMTFLMCFVELEDYLRNSSQIGTDSYDDSSADYELLKNDMLGIIRTYIDPDFSESGDTAAYAAVMEDYIRNAAQAAANNRFIIQNLKDFYNKEEG